MNNLKMVDLQGQYLAIKDEIDNAIQNVIDQAAFIRGPETAAFEKELSDYFRGAHVTGVANGTDALQVAMMALGISEGDEVITPSFTFVATAEAAALLGATPVFVDIDPDTFNMDPFKVEKMITERTRAIVPVHLFGQPCEMDPLMEIARRHDLPVIEDTAQAIGAMYGDRHAGCIGDVGTFSFFPSKNLGAYGDAGAVVSTNQELSERMRLIANHGSRKKYQNEVVGINSRLDGLQAAILRVKLGHLNEYNTKRVQAADRYDVQLAGCPWITTPARLQDRTHIFHQYTIRVSESWTGGRDELATHLATNNIPNAVYYPVPLHQLPVFATGNNRARWGSMDHTEKAAHEVLSLPMHTELTRDQQHFITDAIRSFVEKNGPRRD